MVKETGFRCREIICGVLLLALQGCGQDPADEIVVAVAANFTDTAEILEERFEAETGFDLVLATGSSGQIYSQIRNGAPYDIFLSADEARPAQLVEDGLVVEGMRVTYARGLLALWSADEDMLAGKGEAVLKAGDFRALAIANPDLAPYGLAAMQALGALGLEDVLSDRIVMGQNVGQTFALIASGNAELGFVARSQVMSRSPDAAASSWNVPSDLYAPIRQDAVLLLRAADNEPAIEFFAYLQSDEARAIIGENGYETD